MRIDLFNRKSPIGTLAKWHNTCFLIWQTGTMAVEKNQFDR